MNWYKQSDITTLLDRNDINTRIRDFKEIITTLEYLSKYVFQNASHASAVIKKIHDDKKMSSFPNVKAILHKAYVKALDSYKECSNLCIKAVDRLVTVLEDMEQERFTFTEETNPRVMRERVENAKREKE